MEQGRFDDANIAAALPSLAIITARRVGRPGGTGGAEKAQVDAMVSRLLPGAKIAGPDAADALAAAICHVQGAPFRARVGE